MEKFKELIKTIKESIKSFSVHIKEFGKAFSEPVQEEQSFDELAIAAEIGEGDLRMLKKSMNGVSWEFAEESQESKIVKPTKTIQKETQVQPTIKIMKDQKTLENERD